MTAYAIPEDRHRHSLNAEARCRRCNSPNNLRFRDGYFECRGVCPNIISEGTQ